MTGPETPQDQHSGASDSDRFRDRLGHVTEVGGTEVGHGGFPICLFFLFVFLMIWAAFAWIPPAGTF